MCNTKFKEMTQQDGGRAVRVSKKITAESVGNNKVPLVQNVFFRQVGRVKEFKHILEKSIKLNPVVQIFLWILETRTLLNTDRMNNCLP